MGSSVAACFLLPQTDPLSGGATRDAAVETGDGGIAEAAADAGWCDSTFCDDFDHGALGALWTEVRGLDAGLMSLGAPAVSPPTALVIEQVDGGSKQQKLPMLVKDLPKGAGLRCSFSVLAEVLPPASNAGDLLVFGFAGGGAFVDNEILLSLDKSGLSLREDVSLLDGGCNCPKFDIGPFPISNSLFTRVAMVTDFVTAHIVVNGIEVASHAVTGAGPTPVRVYLGYDRPNGTSRIRLDDFECSVTP